MAGRFLPVRGRRVGTPLRGNYGIDKRSRAGRSKTTFRKGHFGITIDIARFCGRA
ncbi:MAG: hypothetical protein AB1Z18_00130 [Desulfobacterales bacterium]